MEVMKISPRTQAVMLLASALLGMAAGIMLDLIFLLRAACRRGCELGKTAALYRHSFPLIGAIGERRGVVRRCILPIAFLADLLLPPAWAAAQMCVFYAVDDGVFRLSGILASLFGAFAWRGTLGRPTRACGELLIFAVRVAVAYLFYPLCMILRWSRRMIEQCAARIAGCMRERGIKKYSAREWRRMQDMAADGFGLLDTRAPKKDVSAKGRRRSAQAER